MASPASSGIKTNSASPSYTSTASNSSSISVKSPTANSLEDENEQGSSGEEWDMEIGDLIIDLDADLEKEEMKEKGGSGKNSEVRNANNNNSIKGSGNYMTKSPTSSTQATNMNAGVGTTSSKNDGSSCSKIKGATGNGPAPSNPGKTKSKSKKSNKSGSNTKHGGNVAQTSLQSSNSNFKSNRSGTDKDVNSNLPANSRNPKSTAEITGGHSSFVSSTASSASEVKGKNSEVSAADVAVTNKSGGKSVKSGRGYKKHNKNNSSEKKGDGISTSSFISNGGKESREKASKPGKLNKQASNVSQPSNVSSNITHSISTFMPTLSSANGKGKRSNSPSPTALMNGSKFQQYHSNSAAKSTDIVSSQIPGSTVPTISSSCETPVMSVAAQLGKHKKTSSIPSSMKYPVHQLPNVTTNCQAQSSANAPSSSPLNSTSNPVTGLTPTHAVTSGKRDRGITTVTSVGTTTKKIKLEKTTKLNPGGLAANEVDVSCTPAATNHSNLVTQSGLVVSSNQLAGQRDQLASSKCGNRCLAASNANIGDAKLSGANPRSIDQAMNNTNVSSGPYANFVSKASGKSASPGVSIPGQSSDREKFGLSAGNECSAEWRSADVICGDADGSNKRSVGTVTFADASVSTEPEALGPCEPGTSVHLQGIVWHETESGVLVVNVTWRNRSYVGTLLDATKHDWAPPRIPDADSDAEFRVKSGRPKRQRGGNNGSGSGGDAGRKGRKSALANASIVDDLKSTPSSNKRRCKMSESDACSGNDGEICTTPSKSAKRARLSNSRVNSSAKQNLLRNSNANSATAKDSTSGEGTSGSGSSACSSPVFMECPHANCKKRYNNNNALKYHEAHAHYGEDASGAEEAEKSGLDADSPTVDSPKDSDNMSSKSPEELTGSPNNVESEMATQEPTGYARIEADPSAPTNTQAPFVVKRPSEPVQAGQYAGQSFAASDQPPLQQNFTNPTPTMETQTPNYQQEEKRFADLSSSHLGVKEDKQPVTSEAKRGIMSPYSMNDLQTSDSISLKSHSSSTKTPRSYGVPEPSTTYEQPMNVPQNPINTSAEIPSAVDAESAQAVKTLLQLQNSDNQDQLPGLTAYSQTSVAMSTPGQHSAMPVESTMSSSPQSYPSSKSEASMPQFKDPQSMLPQTQGPVDPPPSTAVPSYRGHVAHSEGTSIPAPLPRMSVGISSASTPSLGNQYLVGHSGFATHSHGTVTTNPSQEGGALYTSSGVKMAKGKTVPIPTDPHHTPSTPSQAGGPPTTPGTNSSNGKKAKKKKTKEPGKMPRYSPTDGAVPKVGHLPHPGYNKDVAGPIRYNIQESPSSIRVKQEPSHAVTHPSTHPGSNSLSGAGNAYHKYPSDGNKPNPSQTSSGPQRAMNMKSEPGMGKLLQPSPMHGKGPGFTPPNASHLPRHAMYPQHQEQADTHEPGRAVCSQTLPPNKNNNKPPGKTVDPPNQHGGVPRTSASPAVSDVSDAAVGEGRDHSSRKSSLGESRPRGHLPGTPGYSHSLPGSRSITPVNGPHLSSQASFKPPGTRDANTPNRTQALTPQQRRLKETASPNPHEDRRPSSESNPKANPVALHPQLFMGPGLPFPYSYLSGYEMGHYPFESQFQHHFEAVIHQEIQKGHMKEQKMKEDQRAVAGLASAPSSSQASPSHSESSKMNHPKPTSPSRADRSIRDSSPHRTQRPSIHQVPSQAGSDRRSVPAPHSSLHHPESRIPPRVSPAPPHGNYTQTPNKPHLMTPNTRGISPHSQRTPPPITGNRPPRPSSESERVHRRESSIGDRPSSAVRPATVNPGRKIPSSEGVPRSPEKSKPGAPPTVYASPGIPPQYYANYFDPRNMQFGFPAVPQYMYQSAPIFPGHWSSAPPPAPVPGAPEKHTNPSPRPSNPPRERSSSGSRSPYCEDGVRLRGELREREHSNYGKTKERLSSDGPPQPRKSVTPDPKLAGRNPPADGNSGSTPPTHRHLHTHHHIHEGFPIMPTHHPSYPYANPNIAMASAVMAGTEAAAALATPFQKREIP